MKQIIIKLETMKSIVIDIETMKSLKEFQTEIMKQTTIPIQSQRLIYRNKPLKSINDLHKDCTVNLIINVRKKQIIE